ncbi:type II toxin-antitoxin system RelE/ParE family toxin [Dyadobacter bucti]|uniref:type II toxin-antitoxin system RelE/ParE family toxin n=1 Tax=Dyadobacter bucti TaxID=2572203 RepID=UPI001108957F|nr:type II toxin-antitoxin system RelE/ParE family toxin [Dyadobacter bucti]
MAGIIWSREARQDLDAIFLRLNTESESYSKRWLDDVFKKDRIDPAFSQYGKMGRKVPEIKVANVREIFVAKYRIIYNVRNDEMVEVLAIRHSSKPLSEF